VSGKEVYSDIMKTLNTQRATIDHLSRSLGVLTDKVTQMVDSSFEMSKSVTALLNAEIKYAERSTADRQIIATRFEAEEKALEEIKIAVTSNTKHIHKMQLSISENIQARRAGTYVIGTIFLAVTTALATYWFKK